MQLLLCQAPLLQGMIKNIIPYLAVIILFFLMNSCSNLKYLPAGEALYTGAKVSVKDTNISSKKEKSLQKELQKLTRPVPNKKILGLRLKLFIYNIAGKPKKENSLRGKLKYKTGEPPILLSDLNLERNKQVLLSDLQNQGFFQATITADTVVKKKVASAFYKVTTGIQYKIKEVVFESDSSALTKAISDVAKASFLKPGNSYDFEVIKAERSRIDAYLKEKGFYYFNPDYLIIHADSNVGKNQVNLYVKVKPATSEQARDIYRINDIYIFSNFNLQSSSADTIKKQALYFNGYYILDKQHLYKPQLFERTMLFKHNDIYKRSNHNLTLNRLITLGLFKFVKNRFESVPAVDTASLNTYYYLTPLPKKSIRVELNANTKSNNLTGSQISISWRNRNTFKGGELFTIKALGGFEVQYSGQLKGFNTYRTGLEASLAIPGFVVPFFSLNTRSGFVPKTNILLGYDLLTKQKLYTLNSFRAEYGYTWKENSKKEHQLNPISINYVQPVNVTQLYADSAKNNPTLQKAIDKQFILGSTYSYTFNPLTGDGPQTGLYFNGNIDLSGNIAGLITKPDIMHGDTAKLFHAAFAQYVKAETDLRYYIQAGSKSVWASRLIAGLGYPYGNSSSLPFIKQFFIGGNNSIRAFRSRSIGPGSSVPKGLGTSSFLADRSGDIKLEFNTEYRAKLAGVVNGAVFIDAGNIWLYNNDPEQVGAKFSNQFLKELAVGTGVGLRVDISFLVLRLDLAFPLRKPYLPDGQRWIFDKIDFGSSQWRKENLVFNLAIGYPF